jgi:hypothetical protein
MEAPYNDFMWRKALRQIVTESCYFIVDKLVYMPLINKICVKIAFHLNLIMRIYCRISIFWEPISTWIDISYFAHYEDKIR